jgi:hypothetical protein
MRAATFAALVLALVFALAADGGVALRSSSVLNVPQDYPTIQAAIDAASAGDTVSVAPGTYHERIDNHSKTITIQSTGGAGVTTIDGGAAGAVATLTANAGETPVLRGFTITNGYDDCQPVQRAGGVKTSGGPALIENNVITDNHTCGGEGAGIGAYGGSSATIRGNTISNNSKGPCGGGCSDGDGGGILLQYPGNATIRGNVIRGNAAGAGGGIAVNGTGPGVPTIIANTITGNTARCGNGGGISGDFSAVALIENNVIAGNTVSYGCSNANGGGVYWGFFGSPNTAIVNNTIVGNSTPPDSSGLGSALYIDSGAATVKNNILAGTGGQSAVYCGNFNNTIPPTISFNDVFSPSYAARYGGICADQTGVNGNIGADPRFVQPSSDLHLGCGSPAVDAGTSTGAPPVDIAGTSRPLDGNGDSVAAVDMGAYERGLSCSAPAPFPPTLVAPSALAVASTPFFLHGVGAAGASVKVFDGTNQIATATADASGFYSTTASLRVGTHSLAASQTVAGLTSDLSPPATVFVSMPDLVQQGPKLTGAGESGPGSFGGDVALSADGSTALVGGPDDGGGAGAAWAFTRSGATWSPQGAALYGGDESGPAAFGLSVALSADGNTALVGGPNDNEGAGAAWVFTRSGSNWTQLGPKLIGGGESGAGSFGVDVALSADGNTALIGAPDDADGVGAAWVFTRSGSSWIQQGPKLTGGAEDGPGEFGASVALSGDGSTALTGGPLDNAASEVGAAWAFTRSGGVWSQQGSKLTGSGAFAGNWFGWTVAVSGDGNLAVVGGYPDTAAQGRTWAFVRAAGTWTAQTAPSVFGAGDAYFGYGVGLSSDGNIAVVGGPSDSGNTGAVWTFSHASFGWSQLGPKLTGTGAVGAAGVGSVVAASADGSTVLAGGPGDSDSAGAAWVFGPATVPAPAAPTGVSATPGLGQATVSFTPPPGPVGSYTAIALPGGVTATGTGSPIVVSGLANGTSYTFRVVAANNGGTGPASTPSDATVPGIPTVPTNVTAASGDTSAQVSWSAPATDGGSPITGYVVTPYLGAVPQTPVTVGLVTTASFSGLTNGSTYTFTVSAVNAVGTGPAATSNWVVPAVARPSAPDAPDPGPRPPDPTASGGGGIRPPVPPHH